MHYSYQQYGAVALIYEDDKAICVAKFEDGLWTAKTNPLIGHPPGVRYHFPPSQSGGTLDELIAGIRPLPMWEET